MGMDVELEHGGRDPQTNVTSALWIALSDPGAFIMERKMLLWIKARAEQARGQASPATMERAG